METSGALARAQGGDEAALEALYRAHAPTVLGYLRGLGVPDPEDTAGEVFVALVRDLGRFSGDDDAFRRWLFTIVHRRAVDAHRRRARRREDCTDPAALRALSLVSPDVAHQVATRVTLEPVVRAVDSLTPDQRAVVLLRVVGDLSIADTAAVLGKEVGAVKALQRRAVAALQRAISLRAVS